MIAPRTSAWSLKPKTFFPTAVAAVSSSRIARSTRPHGERSSFQKTPRRMPAVAHTMIVMLAIRVFDVIYVLTAGGPGTSTTTLVWQAYLTTFDSLDFGLGNAYAYTISLITLGLALVYFRVLYGRGEFEA